MSDPQVQRWKQRGKVFLWRYRDKHSLGWNITADPEGNASLRELLERMLASPYSSEKAVAITRPTERVLAVPNIRRGGPESPVKWRIRSVKESEDEWQLEFTGEEIVHAVGTNALRDLIKALDDMRIGHGDYGIGGPKTRSEDLVMVWWYLNEK